MKIRTFRWLLLAVGALHLFYISEAEETALSVIFKAAQPAVYELPGLVGFFQLSVFPLILVYWIILKPYIYNKMTKKAYQLLVPALSAVLIIPLLMYPSRTEVTSDKITTHNLFGQVSEVYEIEDAKLVKTGLSVHAFARRYSGAELDVDLEYTLIFEDDFEWSLSPISAEDLSWKIIEGIEKTVQEKGIEKEVKGKVHYKLVSDFYGKFAGHMDLLYNILNN